MPRRKRLSAEPVTVSIESLSHEGRGVTHINGKTVFVDEALPDEQLVIQYTRQHSRFDEARILEIIKPSADRIPARCDSYAICGGCSFQHANSHYQIEHKQRVMLEQLQHKGGISPAEILPPLPGPNWGYRRRARLGVKYVEKKQKVLIGFREKRSTFIADIKCCEVLMPVVGTLFEDLQELISKLSIYRYLPQIEVAVADNTTVLVFRHLQDLTVEDFDLLRGFERNNIKIYLQPGGIDTVKPLSGEKEMALVYLLDEFGIEFEFLPTDFIQINGDINKAMIKLALELIEPCKQDNVLDLFCGLGNFSLPIARQSKQVTGIEGDTGLINRAKHNARKNNIGNTDFYVANLADQDLQANFMNNNYEKVVIDPPRAGAIEIIERMSFRNTQRIVYVSCNPATLARDAEILVKEKGFRLQKAGVMDMFPHTSHIESIALFTR